MRAYLTAAIFLFVICSAGGRVVSGVLQVVPNSLPELVLQTGHSTIVRSVVISPDGRSIASGSADKTVKIWNAVDGKLLRTLAGHNDKVSTLRFAASGGLLASGSDDKTVRVWNALTGRKLAVFSGQTGVVLALNF